MNIKKKTVGFKKNIKNYGMGFHYNIRTDPMLGIIYVGFRQIPCSCSACLRKLNFPQISTSNINTNEKIDSVFTGLSQVHKKIGILFIILIVKNNAKQPTLE